MHRVKPNQPVMVLQIEIAFPADISIETAHGEIEHLLTSLGTASPMSNILDWRYTGHRHFAVAGERVDKGDIFLAAPCEFPRCLVCRRPILGDARQLHEDDCPRQTDAERCDCDLFAHPDCILKEVDE